MKIRVMYTEYISDEDRRALWWQFNGGQEVNPNTCPMEKRKDVQHYLMDMGVRGLFEARLQYEMSCEEFDEE